MVTCVAQQSTFEMSLENYPRKLLRAATYDSLLPTMTSRKRLLSEQDECRNSLMKFSNDDIDSHKKRKQTESTDHDSSNNKYHVHFFSSFENTTHCPLSPPDQRRKSFTYINSPSYRPLITYSHPSTTTTTTMLVCQPKSIIENNNENDDDEKSHSSIYLSSAQLSAYMTSINNLQHGKLLIIDCGLPLRHNERRIKDSFLLNINDKLSRKRLANRGLKNFLDQNHLNRLNQSEIIILYDDFISPSSSSCLQSTIQPKISPTIKCIFDEIQRYDSNKIIYILQSSFDEFYQHYPTDCYLSSSHLIHYDQSSSPSPSIDLESYAMSEIFPGLYLGNARDAQDKDLLEQNAIKSIINISTTIPCYYEHENTFDYLRLNCQDSSQENILQYFERTFDYMQTKLLSNENILVHCQGGISRSPSFIIGYLMKYHSKSFDQAYRTVKEKRKIINPNMNFLAQLTRYEQLNTITMP